MFTALENNRPFLKMALEGFAGDGKTRTAAEIAIGVHKLIRSDKPIAIFDTERAAKALIPLFKASDIKAIENQARSLASLNQSIAWCQQGNADILIIDSITHVWENYLRAYMDEKRRTRLQFEDWGIIKPKWKAEFSEPFVMANLHIIFTGRAGYEYEDEKDEQGKRQIFKSGIKMKAEGETAFEPDILVLMEQVQDILGDVKRIYRTATVLKDRSDKIDGVTLNANGEKKGPDFGDFYPAIKEMLDGTMKKYTGGEIPDTFQDWESKFSYVKQKKQKVISEVEGAFNLMGLGTSVKDKQLKAAILKKVFNTLSVDKLEDVEINTLSKGLDIINEFSVKYNEYMAKCLADTLTPDVKVIGEMLDFVMSENDPELLNKLFDKSAA